MHTDRIPVRTDQLVEEEPAFQTPVVMPDKVIALPERPIRQERAPLRAEVFRRPDPGFEPMATNVVRPSDGVLFGSNAAERPEVNWATVLFGMAAAAMLVGTLSYGAARFLNGQPVQHLFQISRDESSARIEPQSAQIPTSQSSTPEPVQPSPSSALPPTPTEPKQPDVAVAPTAPDDGRTADASPSPSPVSSPRPEVVPSQPTPSPVSQSAGSRPPAVAGDRGNTARETEKPRAIANEARSGSLPPSRPPLSGGRLILPPPAPTVAPVPPPVRPFELPATAGTSGSLPAPAPAVAPPPAPVSPAPALSSSASPAPAPPGPAPSSRTSAESRAEDTASIRVVLARYEAAYNRLDARAASAVWPRLNEAALDRAFSGLLSQRVALGLCDIAVIGDVAGASCNGKARWEPRIGGGIQTADRSWKFNLRRAQDGWKIEDILVR